MANPEHLAILDQGVEVWNQWRNDNPSIVPNLRFGYLAERDLRQINLQWADLTGVSLRGADLRVSNLSETRLFKMDLMDADLGGANLTGAVTSSVFLSRANLARANLRSTHLCGVLLDAVDLTHATCSFTSFISLDLSQVKGLNTIRHQGPSSIDMETLIRSKGKIPEAFLWGCGVPEEYITYMPSLIGGSAIQYYSCFISYSHADKSFARRVHDTLQARGIRCWLDEHQMLPGHDIFAEVDRGIRLWDKVLLCASQHSLTSWWVDNELETLFKKEQQLMKEHGDKVGALIPLDLDRYLFSDECRTPKKTQIQSRIAADFKGWEHDNAVFEREIERVIKALRTDEGREPPPPPKLGKHP